ncbi:LuxR family quorum-sensing system transcriptional regulator CciR [Burkholderia pyrrocinia]|uniref:LuxR family quorum-sensing system transcriptional regulator CciR n=1 Tax=Burkholderia pyrrocinia TaxID=60550 RepID=A0A318HXB9_BURPY|nr:LuxR family quorum-sensing system transcriptional regulator CciR [Burkholderia pyrrocinia]SFW88837.1 transcriptional regulator, LuxR family [Burkholderia sp. NFACC33-1]SFY46194.1 transcriptional regulator, LuxR family [Burkholderia sp. NFPP32]
MCRVFRYRASGISSKLLPPNKKLTTRIAPFLGPFLKANSFRSLINSFSNTAHSLGFPCYAISRVSRLRSRSSPRIFAETIYAHYPNSWTKHYQQHDYGFIDPVHRAAFTYDSPYRWSEIFGLSELERRVLWEAHDAGLTHGLSIPIHESDGSVLLFNFSGPSSRVNAPLNSRLAHLTSSLFHVELQRLTSIPHIEPPTLRLSSRQQECLYWVGQGKTSPEISIIMGISHHTVDYHITEAMKILNVNSRTKAAVYASVYGLIPH